MDKSQKVKDIVASLFFVVLIAISVFYFFQEPTADHLIEIKNDEKNYSVPAERFLETVKVYQPVENELVSSPLKIRGEARGFWFFEASFPIILVNWDGLIIAEGLATAKTNEGETWMTEKFVPFEAEIHFLKPDCGTDEYCQRGALILKKDNPSGLPENDGAYEMQIKFK